MGKRFGRNQRRKMMAELGEAGRTMDRLSEMLDHERAYRGSLQGRIEEWESRIRRLLGEYSVFLSKPTQVRVSHFMERLPAMMSMHAFRPRPDGMIASIEESMEYLTLHLFEVIEREDAVKLSRNVLLVQVDNSQRRVLAGHSIDQKVIHERNTPALVEFIATSLTQHAIREAK